MKSTHVTRVPVWVCLTLAAVSLTAGNAGRSFPNLTLPALELPEAEAEPLLETPDQEMQITVPNTPRERTHWNDTSTFDLAEPLHPVNLRIVPVFTLRRSATLCDSLDSGDEIEPHPFSNGITPPPLPAQRQAQDQGERANGHPTSMPVLREDQIYIGFPDKVMCLNLQEDWPGSDRFFTCVLTSKANAQLLNTDRQLVARGGHPESLRLHPFDFNATLELQGPTYHNTAMDTNPTGSLLVFGAHSNSLSLLDLSTCQLIQAPAFNRMNALNQRHYAIRWSEIDPNTIATLNTWGLFQLWDLRTSLAAPQAHNQIFSVETMCVEHLCENRFIVGGRTPASEGALLAIDPRNLEERYDRMIDPTMESFEGISVDRSHNHAALSGQGGIAHYEVSQEGLQKHYSYPGPHAVGALRNHQFKALLLGNGQILVTRSDGMIYLVSDAPVME